eukprot:COSAG02_NODE_1027_length_15115_cov_118.186867_5_plen_33_part_00
MSLAIRWTQCQSHSMAVVIFTLFIVERATKGL